MEVDATRASLQHPLPPFEATPLRACATTRTVTTPPAWRRPDPLLSSSGDGGRDRRDVEDLDEALEEVGLAGDVDRSAVDRVDRVELAGEQGVQRHVRLDDEVWVGERAFVDLERSVVDACVDDDLAEAELVANL